MWSRGVSEPVPRWHWCPRGRNRIHWRTETASVPWTPFPAKMKKRILFDGFFCQIHPNHPNLSDNHPDVIRFLLRFIQIWSTPMARDPNQYPAGDHRDPIDFTKVTSQGHHPFRKQRSYHIKMTVKRGVIFIFLYTYMWICVYIYIVVCVYMLVYI